MKIDDRRTDEQRKTRVWFVTATDKCLSRLLRAGPSASKCAWAYETKSEALVAIDAIRARCDMRHVKVNYCPTWKPRCSHLSIYIGEGNY